MESGGESAIIEYREDFRDEGSCFDVFDWPQPAEAG